MTVAIEAGYTLPAPDYSLKHARIGHSGNWLSGGSVAADTTATGYFTNGPLTSLTYEKWKPTAIPATWEYTHTGAAECDYCAIAAHKFGTNANTVSVQYYDGSWVTVLTTSPTDDSPIMAIFEPVTATKWRLSVSAGTAPEVGVVKFGKAMQMARPFFGGHSPIDYNRQTILRSNQSETGEYLGRTKQRIQLGASFSWANLPAPWVRAHWPGFQRAVEAEPFFIAWRPEDAPDVGYCLVDQIPAPSNMGMRDLMSVEMQVRGYGWD